MAPYISYTHTHTHTHTHECRNIALVQYITNFSEAIPFIKQRLARYYVAPSGDGLVAPILIQPWRFVDFEACIESPKDSGELRRCAGPLKWGSGNITLL